MRFRAEFVTLCQMFSHMLLQPAIQPFFIVFLLPLSILLEAKNKNGTSLDCQRNGLLAKPKCFWELLKCLPRLVISFTKHFRLSWSGRDDAVAYEWEIVGKPPTKKACPAGLCFNLCHFLHPILWTCLDIALECSELWQYAGYFGCFYRGQPAVSVGHSVIITSASSDCFCPQHHAHTRLELFPPDSCSCESWVKLMSARNCLRPFGSNTRSAWLEAFGVGSCGRSDRCGR